MAADNQSESRYGVHHTGSSESRAATVIVETLMFSIVALLLIVLIFLLSSLAFPSRGVLKPAPWPDQEPRLQIPIKEKRITPSIMRKDIDALQAYIANAAVTHGGGILDESDRNHYRMRVVLTEGQADSLEESITTSKKQIRYGPKEEMPYVQWAATGYLPEPSEDEILVTTVIAPHVPVFTRGWAYILLMVSLVAVPSGFALLRILSLNFVDARRYRNRQSSL